MGNIREVSHKYLSGKSRYDYCPACVKHLEEEEGISDWMAKEKLKPLRMVKTCESIKQKDGSYSDYYDTHYECIKCGLKNINTDTFTMYYCCRADGTRYNQPPKEPGSIWSREKNCMVPAKYNFQLKKWEEIVDKTDNV